MAIAKASNGLSRGQNIFLACAIAVVGGGSFFAAAVTSGNKTAVNALNAWRDLISSPSVVMQQACKEAGQLVTQTNPTVKLTKTEGTRTATCTVSASFDGGPN